jgi:hypothetical protein
MATTLKISANRLNMVDALPRSSLSYDPQSGFFKPRPVIFPQAAE